MEHNKAGLCGRITDVKKGGIMEQNKAGLCGRITDVKKGRIMEQNKAGLLCGRITTFPVQVYSSSSGSADSGLCSAGIKVTFLDKNKYFE